MKYENDYFDHDLIKKLDHSRGEKQLYTSGITPLRSKNIFGGAQRNPLKNVREQLWINLIKIDSLPWQCPE